MIKVITFDFVGVLALEKDIELSEKEDKMERLFGPNLNDYEYIRKTRKIVDDELLVTDMAKEIINKLYEIKDKDIFKKIKNKYNDIKIIIATNHV